MKVKDVMTRDVRSCTPDTDLAAAAALMLDGDCGLLPIVQDGRIAGVVTDRDLFIALGTRDKRASELTVGDVIQAPALTCKPDDDIQAALDTMKQHRIRRLPVEGFGGAVVGIVSMNDIVLAAGARKPVAEAQVVSTLQSICSHHRATPRIVAA
jgi:CBS domain-containing protein